MLSKCSATESHSPALAPSFFCFHTKGQECFPCGGAHGVQGGTAVQCTGHVFLAEALPSHTNHRAPFQPKADTRLKKENADLGTKKKVCSSRVPSVLLQSCPSLFLVWTLVDTVSHWPPSHVPSGKCHSQSCTTGPHALGHCLKEMTVRIECDLGVLWQLR